MRKASAKFGRRKEEKDAAKGGGKDEPRLDWIDEELFSIDRKEDVVEIRHDLHGSVFSRGLDRDKEVNNNTTRVSSEVERDSLLLPSPPLPELVERDSQ